MDWTYRKGEQTSVHKYLNYKSDREVKENAVETFRIKFKKFVTENCRNWRNRNSPLWYRRVVFWAKFLKNPLRWKIQIIAIISRVIRDFRSAIESIVLAIGFVLIFIQGVKRYALEKKFASLHE